MRQLVTALLVSFTIAIGPAFARDAYIPSRGEILLNYLNGSFCALFMLVSGLLALLFGICAVQTKRRRLFGVASIAALVLTVGSFVLRSFANTWFNTASIGSLL